MPLCTPTMGMNLWSVLPRQGYGWAGSPLYVNSVYVNDSYHRHKYWALSENPIWLRTALFLELL